jgi:hypothetical protein
MMREKEIALFERLDVGLDLVGGCLRSCPEDGDQEERQQGDFGNDMSGHRAKISKIKLFVC